MLDLYRPRPVVRTRIIHQYVIHHVYSHPYYYNGPTGPMSPVEHWVAGGTTLLAVIAIAGFAIKAWRDF